MEHQFTLRYRLDQTDATRDVDEILEQLGEVGCTDAIVGIGVSGTVVLDFSRSATSREYAVSIAIADVESFIQTAVLQSIEYPDGEVSADAVLLAKMAIMEGLMNELVAWFEVNQHTYASAATILGVKASRIFEAIRRNPEKLTVDTLVEMLLRAGKGVNLEVSESLRSQVSVSDLTSTLPRTDEEIRRAMAQGRVAELKPDQV